MHQDKRIKELKHQNQILVEELNQSKQKIDFLEKNIDQLTIGNQEQVKQIEKQGKSIERLEERWQVLLTGFSKLPGILALLSFVSNNETQQVFDNLANFLLNEYIPDCHIMENCWSYRQKSEMILNWVVTDFRRNQQEQIDNYVQAIYSPYYSTGEKGYFVKVNFDPYGYKDSRGTHLSCCLFPDKRGPHDSDIRFPHQQQFRVTIINLKDRKNDISAETTFEMSKPPVRWGAVHYIHKILSLTDVKKFVINDKLILKIHVKYHSA